MSIGKKNATVGTLVLFVTMVTVWMIFQLEYSGVLIAIQMIFKVMSIGKQDKTVWTFVIFQVTLLILLLSLHGLSFNSSVVKTYCHSHNILQLR